MNFNKESTADKKNFGEVWGGGGGGTKTVCQTVSNEVNRTRKSVHRTRMPPPNAIQKKGLYVTVTGIP